MLTALRTGSVAASENQTVAGRGRQMTTWLLALTLMVVASGMAYTLWWPSVVRHQGWYWLAPADIWGTIRAAHWIDWGAFSYIYSSRAGLVTLPGFHVLLAPVVALSSALGLSESAPGIAPGVPKPQEWLLVGPIVLACSAMVLFAVDALARRLGGGLSRRRLLSLGAAAGLWPTVAIWGHGEDVLALGLAIYALVAILNDRLVAAGWLLGAALAMQLYVVALVPLFIGVVGFRKGAALIARGSIIPGFLLTAVLVPNFHGSIHALLDQPNFPSIDHATPWVLLAPKLAHGAVAAGPGRIVGLGLAVAGGFLAKRIRHKPVWIVWLAAVVLATRCLFESVMDPYYVMPAVVVALVAATDVGWTRFLGTCAAGAGLTVLTYFRPDMWAYWFEMAGATAALLALAWPGPRSHRFHLAHVPNVDRWYRSRVATPFRSQPAEPAI